MTSKHSGLPRVQCALIHIKPEKNKYVWRAELFLKLTKTAFFTYFKSSSYSLCTISVWFKAVLKKNLYAHEQAHEFERPGVVWAPTTTLVAARRLAVVQDLDLCSGLVFSYTNFYSLFYFSC